MRRRIVRWFLVINLVLLLLLSAEWTRSAYRSDFLLTANNERELSLQSDRGRLIFVRLNAPPPRHGASWEVSEGGFDIFSYSHGRYLWGIDNTIDVYSGQAWVGNVSKPNGTFVRATVYYWVPAALLTIPLLIYLLVLARRLSVRYARWNEGLCFACGYDLRGGTSAQCPECGAEIDPSRRIAFRTP